VISFYLGNGSGFIYGIHRDWVSFFLGDLPTTAGLKVGEKPQDKRLRQLQIYLTAPD
jgi:hypothetical protein